MKLPFNAKQVSVGGDVTRTKFQKAKCFVGVHGGKKNYKLGILQSGAVVKSCPFCFKVLKIV